MLSFVTGMEDSWVGAGGGREVVKGDVCKIEDKANCLFNGHIVCHMFLNIIYYTLKHFKKI